MSIKLDLGAVTAYAIAVKNGFKGTEADWLASLKGAKGDKGEQGPQGEIPEDYPQIKKDVSQLKEDIGAITGNKKIIGWSERKKYLNTAVQIVNVNNPISTELNYRYVVVPCVEGDIFTINGESGPETRLWCFTDETYNVLTKSDENATASNLEVIAPHMSAYLILNDKTDTVSYVGRLLHICVKRNNEAVTQIQNKLEDFNDITEISKFIAHVDKRNLLNNASVRENIAYNNWMPNTMYDTRNLDGWYSIPIIPVEAGKQYCFTHNNKKQFIESIYNYNKYGNFTGTIKASAGVYTIPDKCCYIALSRKNSFVGWNFREYIDGMDYSFVEYKQKDYLVYTKNEINEIIKPKFSVPTYYFSENGSDLNSGLSEIEPKQNPKPFIEAGNCNVLLRGGDTFKTYGLLFGSNLSIKSYGNGKAKINGINIEESEWLNDGNGYYSSVISEDMPSYIVIDGKEYWSKLIKSEPEKHGVWKFDRLNKKITIKFDVDISGEKVIYATGKQFGSLINCENVVIDGIEVESVKSYIGISNSRNIVIKNCYIHHCGGGIQDYNDKQSTVENGGGVTVVLNGCKYIYCFKNVFDYMFDQALSAQMWVPEPDNSDSEEIYFCNNIVTRSWYGFEIFANDTNTTNRHHVVVKNNYFADQFDVTNGYREGDNVANNKYPALLMCWNMNGNNDIHINDNVFNRSNDGYAAVVSGVVSNIFDVSGNIFVCNNSEKTSLIHPSATGFVDSIITVLNPDTDGIISDTAYEVIGKRKVGYN